MKFSNSWFKREASAMILIHAALVFLGLLGALVLLVTRGR